MRSGVLIYILIMAGVTYMIRMLPMVVFRKEIKNTFVRSFLYYVPYTALAVMTFPGILLACDSIWAGLGAMAVALVLALKKRGIVTVSLAAVAAVFVLELILPA